MKTKKAVVHVNAEIADAFGMRGLPNTVVHETTHTPPPKPDTSRKAWEAYRKENLGGLCHNSLALSYDDWKDKKMNEYCIALEGLK